MNNLTKRILSAIILAPIVLYIIYIGGMAFNIMVGIAFAIMMWEWCRMTKTSPKKWIWWIGGLIYIGVACIALMAIPHEVPQEYILIIFVTIWAKIGRAHV